MLPSAIHVEGGSTLEGGVELLTRHLRGVDPLDAAGCLAPSNRLIHLVWAETTAGVVDENLIFAGGDIIGADVVNGEVESGRCPFRPEFDAINGDEFAVGGADEVTAVEVLGLLPLVVGGVPERVVFGGGDDAAVDLEVDDGVFVFPHMGYLAWASLAGLGVFSQDFIADFDLRDRFG